MDNTTHYKAFQKTTQQTSNIIKLCYAPSFLCFIYINSFNPSNNACRIDISLLTLLYDGESIGMGNKSWFSLYYK